MTMASIYLRVSRDFTGEELAVSRQEALCRELCERHGWDVTRVFVDNSVSASSGKRRPAFEALLESKPELIVMWSVDRLVRKGVDLEKLVSLDVPVHSVQAGPMDLATASGRLNARLLVSVATFESEMKAERQKASNIQRARAGKAHWGHRPFGFTFTGEHVPEEAQAIVDAYDSLLRGNSVRSIVRTWNGAGLRTNRDGLWVGSSVRVVLLAERNAGLRFYRGETVGKAAWEPIVPEETWRAAVALFADPSRRRSTGAPPSSLLTGFATCGKCGTPVSIAVLGKRSQKGPYRVYRCRSASSCVTHPEDLVDGLVFRRLMELQQDEAYRQAWATYVPEGAQVDAGALKEEEVTLRERQAGLGRAYASGAIDDATLAAGSEHIRTRLAEIAEALAKVGQAESYTGVDDEWAWQEWDGLGVEARRQAVRQAFTSIVLMPRGKGHNPVTQAHVLTTVRLPGA